MRDGRLTRFVGKDSPETPWALRSLRGSNATQRERARAEEKRWGRGGPVARQYEAASGLSTRYKPNPLIVELTCRPA